MELTRSVSEAWHQSCRRTSLALRVSVLPQRSSQPPQGTGRARGMLVSKANSARTFGVELDIVLRKTRRGSEYDCIPGKTGTVAALFFHLYDRRSIRA